MAGAAAARTALPLTEQVGMRSRADQQHFLGRHLVDQQPIRIDVAIQSALPLSRQLVWAVAFRQDAGLGQQFDGDNEFLDVFAAPPLAPEVGPELRLLPDPPHRALQRTYLPGPFRN